MAKLIINRGTLANDGTGDNLRDGANKINLNFDEIYTAIGNGTTVDGTVKFADDSSTVATISANGETLRVLGGTGIDTTISGNDLTIGVDGTVLSASQVSTLTNKSIALGSNTITGTTAEFNTALTDNDFATLAGTEALTNKDLTGSGNTFPTITIRDDSSTEDAVSLGETLIVTGGTGITSSVASNTLTLDIDSTVATLTGSQELTNKTINASSNTISNIVNANLSGSAAISNANLANSSITLGDDAISLGGTQTTITNLSLDGSTGTIDLTSSGNKLRFNYAGTGSFPSESTYEGMFAYDTTGNEAYVADAGGWVKLLNENSSVSAHADVNITGVANDNILVWSSAQARFNVKSQKILSSAEIDVTNDGSSAYLFNSHYSGNNPTIYVRAGATYAFNLDVSGHPFHLQTVSGAYSSGNAYTTGLTHIATDGTITTGASALLKESGTLYYEIPSGTSTTIYYACQYHSGMAGSIVVQDDTASASVSFTTDKSNTGDGSTTAFTVTSGRTVDDVLVFVNGICLVPTDDYTISSTTLTFTVAPVASAEIVFRYLG